MKYGSSNIVPHAAVAATATAAACGHSLCIFLRRSALVVFGRKRAFSSATPRVRCSVVVAGWWLVAGGGGAAAAGWLAAKFKSAALC